MSTAAPPPPAPAAPATSATPGTPTAPPPKVRRRSDRGPIYGAILAVVVVVIVVGVGAGTSWYGLRPASSTSPCPTGLELQGNGAAFPAAIVDQWASTYHTSSGNTVNYVTSSAGGGVTLLTEKSVDFAVTDEGLNATQSTALTAAVGTFLTLPVTGSGVAIIYTLSGYAGPLNFTGAELAGIYLGTINTWDNSELVANNPGLSGITTAITAVHRSDPAGQSYVLTNLLTLDNATWRTTASLGTSLTPTWPVFSGAEGASGNSAMITDVKVNGAIGYTDLYDALSKGLAIASIVDSHGAPVYPTEANVQSAINDIYAAIGSTLPGPTGNWASVSFVNSSVAGDYPLAALVYVIVPQDPGHGHTATIGYGSVLRQWLNYVFTTGQTFNRTAFPFASPPAGLLTQDLGALPTLTFNGTSIPSCG